MKQPIINFEREFEALKIVEQLEALDAKMEQPQKLAVLMADMAQAKALRAQLAAL
jgi:predicted component of type VI protein secretion system